MDSTKSGWDTVPSWGSSPEVQLPGFRMEADHRPVPAAGKRSHMRMPVYSELPFQTESVPTTKRRETEALRKGIVKQEPWTLPRTQGLQQRQAPGEKQCGRLLDTCSSRTADSLSTRAGMGNRQSHPRAVLVSSSGQTQSLTFHLSEANWNVSFTSSHKLELCSCRPSLGLAHSSRAVVLNLLNVEALYD